MLPTFLSDLPADLQSWRGTAAALAEKCNQLLPQIGLGEDAGSANERLVRHYVQIGVLETPERDGREALFDQRQVRQFLTARYLLKDGWPLAKITELMRSTGIDGVSFDVTRYREPTPAELTLQRLRNPPVPPPPMPATHVVPPPVPPARAAGPLGKLRSRLFPPLAEVGSSSDWGTPDPPATGPVAPERTILRQAAEITQRRLELKANLAELGNPTGEAVRRRTVQISLTPWCQVFVDSDELSRLPPTTAETLGTALTQALHEERINRGDKT